MIEQEKVEQQLRQLYQAHEYWSKKAQEAIALSWKAGDSRKLAQSGAASNASKIGLMCQTLEFVLTGKPLPPVFEDNGNRYGLALDEPVSPFSESEEKRNAN